MTSAGTSLCSVCTRRFVPPQNGHGSTPVSVFFVKLASLALRIRSVLPLRAYPASQAREAAHARASARVVRSSTARAALGAGQAGRASSRMYWRCAARFACPPIATPQITAPGGGSDHPMCLCISASEAARPRLIARSQTGSRLGEVVGQHRHRRHAEQVAVLLRQRPRGAASRADISRAGRGNIASNKRGCAGALRRADERRAGEALRGASSSINTPRLASAERCPPRRRDLCGERLVTLDGLDHHCH